MRKKLFAVLACLLSICPRASGFELPDEILDWRYVSEHVVKIIPDSTGENLGRVLYKSYERKNPTGTMQIILTEGTGTGELYVPDEANNSKGLMPSGSGYKILEVSGHKSILEAVSYMPAVLAVNFGNNITFTIESFALNEAEIVNLAEELIKWNNTKSD